MITKISSSASSIATRSCRFYLRVQYKQRLGLTTPFNLTKPYRSFSTTPPIIMSFSNTDTGSKSADPYKDKNLDTPDLKTKIEDLVKFTEQTKFCMLTTRIASSGLLVSRAMAVAGRENNGINLLFHTNTESGKTDDLESDPKINVAFINSSGEWASISGQAEIITDRELVRKHYSQSLKAWLGDLGDGKHDGGPEDPRIGVIKVNARTATYAIAEGTFVGRGAEVVKGAVTGAAPKVNKLREISEAEIDQWSKVASS